MSDAVVLVNADASYQQVQSGITHTYCDFTVMVAAKGPMVQNDIFTLRQYSYTDQIGELNIVGDFVPKYNHNYLMFLNQLEDGSWRLMMLSYYVFEESLQEANQYLIPVKESLSIGTFPRPDGLVAEPLTAYREETLLQLLQQQATGSAVPWDPGSAQISLPALTSTEVSDRALPVGCDFDLGGGISRWQNPTINMYYDVTNAPSDVVPRFQGAINTLNTQYAGLNLMYGGPTNFTPDCSDMSIVGQDFINYLNTNLNGNQSILLLFDDPCNNITDLVNCSGVLALGGGYMLSTTHVFKGLTWKNAAWGYVFTNNGVRACLSDINYERLLTHELTHALKMDHLDAVLYPNNNMNATCCNAINTKDRECMNYVYDSPLPVELVAFTTRLMNNGVALSWSTAQEINNDHFIIERSPDALQFELLANVAASNLAQAATYTLTDDRPLGGLNYYRLSQMDRDGKVVQLAMRAINFRGEVNNYTLAPNPANGNSIVLSTSQPEADLQTLQIFNPAGTLILQMNNTASSNRMEVPIGDLPSGLYWLKVEEPRHTETLKFIRL